MIIGNAIMLGGAGGASKIFGDGSDGVGLFTSNTTWLAETEDTGMIIKNFESLTISEGATVSAGNRNCGMIIRVKGDCTIHGTLANKMSCKTLLDSDGVDFSLYPASMLSSKAGDGGAGGTGSINTTATNRGTGGSGMVGRFYGGGWSGGGGGGNGDADYTPGNGGSASDVTTAISNIFVGGAGGARFASGKAGTYGGGGGANGNYANSAGGSGGSGPGSYGGPAANQSSKLCGGGAGNYGGGVIILLVGGKLTITGGIDCSGSNGGDSGVSGEYCFPGGPGGGGGGGRIFICHKGAIVNNGILNVNGGESGAILGKAYGGNYQVAIAGTAGSVGTIAVKDLKQYKREDVA